MNESNGYAVFFFPQALEALGDAIKPYLQDGPMGPHVICNEIDTGGALLEMTIQGVTTDGKTVMLELMVPGSMVRMVVSSQSDATFGFGPRIPIPVTALPAVGPQAVQLSTGTLVVLFGVQVVVVQKLPADAALAVHEATPVGPVTTGAGQVVVVQLLAPDAAAAVQVATGTFVVTFGAGQVTVV